MKTTKKQTAVEWLSEKIYEKFKEDISYDVFKQAKEMEKQQIIDAHIFSELHHGNGMIMPSETEFKESAEQYYKETYEI